MRLRRLLLKSVVIAIASTPLSSVAATRNYTITGFDTLRVQAPVSVIVTSGTGPSARADGDASLIDRLRLDISGQILKVTLSSQADRTPIRGKATLYLRTGNLRLMQLAGSGSISVDQIRGQSAYIIVDGSGDVNVANIQVDSLNVQSAGSGRATLAGRAETAALRMIGTGEIAANRLIAKQLSVNTQGAGKVAAAATTAAQITASGSGNTTVNGSAACKVSNLGSGQVTCAGKIF